jgi:hypothetical protein
MSESRQVIGRTRRSSCTDRGCDETPLCGRWTRAGVRHRPASSRPILSPATSPRRRRPISAGLDRRTGTRQRSPSSRPLSSPRRCGSPRGTGRGRAPRAGPRRRAATPTAPLRRSRVPPSATAAASGCLAAREPRPGPGTIQPGRAVGVSPCARNTLRSRASTSLASHRPSPLTSARTAATSSRHCRARSWASRTRTAPTHVHRCRHCSRRAVR